MTQIQNERFDIVDLLRRWFVVLVLAGFVGGVIGYVVADTRPPSYSTTVDLLVGPVVPNADVLEGTSDLARTYGEILESRQILAPIARAAGLDPSDVSVSATSEPRSSKLVLRVRTPDSEATKEVASSLIESLEAVVSEARPASDAEDVNPPASADQLGAQIVGNAVVVTINRGDLATTDRSMPLAVGAGAGFVGAMLIVTSLLLTVEQRRRNFEGIASSQTSPGFDLGRFRTSRWNDLPLRGRRMSVASRASLGLAVDSVTDGLNRDAGRRTLFVTSPDSSTAHLEVIVQLARRLEPVPMIVDPFGHLVRRLLDDRIEPGACYEVVVDNHIVAFCAVPQHVGLFPDAIDELSYERVEPGAARVVFASLDDDADVWRRWAADSDSTLLLLKRGGDPTRLSRLWTRIGSLELPVLGTLWCAPHWIVGQRCRVYLQRSGTPAREGLSISDDRAVTP